MRTMFGARSTAMVQQDYCGCGCQPRQGPLTKEESLARLERYKIALQSEITEVEAELERMRKQGTTGQP